MTRADVLSALRRQTPELQALGVKSLYLFGSAARGEARDDSDVDLFVDYDSERFSFVELIRTRETISRTLGRTADLTTRDGLHPMLRPQIEAEAVKVF
jgi:predicted nucleotidyltransferase